MAAAIGIKGHCAQCNMTFELKPWQLNAIAIDIPFDCTYCHCGLQLGCVKQLRQFRALDQWALVRPSMRASLPLRCCKEATLKNSTILSPLAEVFSGVEARRAPVGPALVNVALIRYWVDV